MLPYNDAFAPPAPTLPVELFIPGTSDPRVQVIAKLDTAADISAVPASILTQLGIQPEGDIYVSGFSETPTAICTCTVGIEMQSARIRRIKVVPIQDECMLLGRDVLNHFYILLAGPDLSFEMRTQR